MSDDRIFLGLGSNLEEPIVQLRSAIRTIDALDETRLVRASSLYRTAPWGIDDQPPFINAVIEVRCTLEPDQLMAALLGIEAEAGRKRALRWGPRIIDLDILAWGDRQIDIPGLTVPHPRISGRDFVLIPWAEIAPDFEIPGTGIVGELVGRLAAEERPAPERLDKRTGNSE